MVCCILTIQNWTWFGIEVVAYDACQSGFGIVSSAWPLIEVKKAGRTLERSRFKLCPAVAPRASALAAMGLGPVYSDINTVVSAAS